MSRVLDQRPKVPLELSDNPRKELSYLGSIIPSGEFGLKTIKERGQDALAAYFVMKLSEAAGEYKYEYLEEVGRTGMRFVYTIRALGIPMTREHVIKEMYTLPEVFFARRRPRPISLFQERRVCWGVKSCRHETSVPFRGYDLDEFGGVYKS